LEGEEEEKEVRGYAQSTAFIKRPTPPLVEEETLFLKYVNV
jgi:hypothetical protein